MIQSTHPNDISILEHLHQREPHLWVDEIVHCNSSTISSKVNITADHPILAGHFPGSPVVPGSIIQEMCTQSAAILMSAQHVPKDQRDQLAIGVLMSVQQAKYRHAVKPPENCHIHVELLSKVENVFRFRAVVETKAPLEKDAKKSNIVAKIRFTLANLPMEFITSSPENSKASIPKI